MPRRIAPAEGTHQVVVHRGAGGLHHEHVGAPDGLVDGHEILAVGEGAGLGVAQGDAELLADALGQGLVGAAGENFQILAV